jgi:hypothetical protein
MQNLPNYFTTPNKMTSENDIKGLVSLKFLRPCHAGHVALWDDRSPSSPCRLTGNYCNYLPSPTTLNFAYITLFYGWYTVKKGFSIFPFPAGMSLTKLSLGGNNNVIYKLFPSSESLVSDIPAAEGNIE